MVKLFNKVIKEEKEEKKESKESKRLYLKSGETIKLVKGETPHYDRTEAPPGIMVGKVKKFV